MTRSLPSPSELIAHLDRFVYGQHDAKRTLCTAAYKHYLGIAQALSADDGETQRLPAFGRQHTLLCGDTGSGKTLLVRHLGDLLDVPVAFCRATSLVEAGYVGEQVESLVASLLAAAGGDVARAERGIIFVDEIDKIRRTPEAAKDVSGEGVQNALLALLDGNEVRVGRDSPTRVDTSQVLFLAAGAFTGIDRIIRERDGGHERVGFGPNLDAPTDRGAGLSKRDLIDFGLIPELVGRFTHVRRLARLGIEDLARILDEVEGSILARTRHYFMAHDIDLRFSSAARRAIAAEAETLGTGARGLDSVVGRVLEPMEWELMESSRPVRRVLVTANTVVFGHRPQVQFDSGQPQGAASTSTRLREFAFARASKPVATDSRPIRLTDTRGWPEERIRKRIETVREQLDWENTTGSARKWWQAFENENSHRIALVLRLAEELKHRKATITEFFLAYVYSNTDNIQANLHYLDYKRLKKHEDDKNKATAERARREREQEKGLDEVEELAARAERDPIGDALAGEAEKAPPTDDETAEDPDDCTGDEASE